jgi:hypothetical protein
MAWQDSISPTDPGESGRVYFLNVMMTFDKHYHAWTKGMPFTLNPQYGKTLEGQLKASKALTRDVKNGLLQKRFYEVKLDNGNMVKWWIGTERAPNTWGTKPETNLIWI